MNRLSRATALKIAALLSLSLGIYVFAGSLPLLAQGAEALEEGAGFVFTVVVFVFGILRIIGAYGVWMNQRWGIILTVLANVLDGILAAPGLLFAPSLEWRINALLGVLGALAIVVLCFWRDRKPTLT